MYFEWCKKFGKTVSDDCFLIFVASLKDMESEAAANGVEMELNLFADITKEEMIEQEHIQNWESTRLGVKPSRKSLIHLGSNNSTSISSTVNKLIRSCMIGPIIAKRNGP
jgi:hypothetical protein